MPDILGILCVLGIVVAVMTVLGHGLWMLVVVVFREIGGDTTRPASRPRRNCPACGSVGSVVAGACRHCDYRAGARSQPTLSDDLEAAGRQLDRMHHQGRLSDEQHVQLSGFLRDDMARLRGAPPIRLPDDIAGLPGSVPPKRPPVVVETVAIEPEPMLAELVEMPVVPVEWAKPQAVPSDSVASEPTVRPVEARPPAKPPSRPLADVLQGFMEEKNIRLGELVAGMLIVGSAIGLVISLWSTLKDAIPYFPALLFMLITVAMYGAGMYTLRRWRLRSTSRGLLVIATLLVPLNFLAAIALSENQPVTDPLYIIAVSVGLVTFGLVVFSACRALLIQGWPLAWIAVMGTSGVQLVIARRAEVDISTQLVWMLMAVPLACFLVACGGQLMLSVRWRRFTRRRVGQMFLLLGLASFALFMPAGLLISKTEALQTTLAQLSPALSLMMAGVLGLALVVHQRATSPALATLRTAGTSLAVFAALVMLAAVGLAWSDPPLLVAVGLANFAALTAIAMISRTPLLHVPAVVSAALATMVGYHAVTAGAAGYAIDQTDRLLYVLLMGRSGLLLLALAGLAVGGAALWQFVGRVAEARSYLVAGAGLAALSVMVASYAGFYSLIDAHLATPVFAICAAGLLGAAVVTRRSEIVPIGSVLLLVALVHALSPQLNEPLGEFLTRLRLTPDRPLLVALLLHAATCMALAIASTYWRRGGSADDKFARRAPLTYSALISSAVALPIVLVVMQHHFAAHAVYALCIAIVWLTFALLHGWRPLFSAFQAMATVSLLFAVTAICQRQSWWTGRLLDPRHLQAELSALALWSVVWVVIRWVTRTSQLAQRLFVISWIAVDRLVLAIVVRGVVLLSLAACLPAVLSELWPAAVVTALQPLDIIVMAFVAVFALTAIATWTKADSAPLTARWAIGLNASVVGGLLFLALGGVDLFDWYWNHVGVEHEVGHGIGAWTAVGLAVVALAAHGCVRSSTWSLLGLLGTGLAVVLLIAAAAGDSAASVLRWELAIYGGLIAAAVCCRDELAALAIGLGVKRDKIDRLRDAAIPRTLMLAVTAVPLLGLSGLTVVANVVAAGTDGADVEGMFALVGAAATHYLPLLVLAATLGLYAARERVGEFALAGSLVAVLAAALAYTIPGWTSPAHTASQTAAGLFYSTALALAVCTLLWRATRLESARQISEPLAVQFALLAAAVVIPVAWVAVAVFVQPGQLVEAAEHLGGPAGFAAVLLAGVALGWSLWQWRRQVFVHLILAAAVSLAVLFAAATFDRNTAANWFAFHGLASAWVVVAALACLVTCAAPYLRPAPSNEEGSAGRLSGAFAGAARPAFWWTIAIGGAIVLLALRSAWSDPLRPDWPTAAAGAAAVLAALLALRSRSQPLAYASTALAALATTIFITGPWTFVGQFPDSLRALIELIQVNVVAVSLAATLWLAADLWWQRRAAAAMDVRFRLPPVHRITGLFGVISVAVMSGVCVAGAALAREFFATTSDPTIGTLTGWLAVASLAVLLFASLWDRDARHALPGLYLLGLTTAAGVLDRLPLRIDDLRIEELMVYVAMAISGYVVLTGMLWSYRGALRTLARGAIMPEVDRRIEQTWRWLPSVTLVLVAAVVVIDVWVVLTFGDGKDWLPLAAATTTALAAVGVAALAHGRWRERMPLIALLVAAAALVDLAWAMQPVTAYETIALHRAVRLLMALAIAMFAYGVVLVRLTRTIDNWFGAARRAATLLGGAALLTLLATLALEGAAYDSAGRTPLEPTEIAQVAIVLVALAAAFVSLALLPGRDPLGLSEKGRMVYVYAAELVAALLFLHIFMTMPELFQERFKPYWPLIVLAIAYAGAGASALFDRAGLNVLAEPLRRSGAFLPLLPALAFWTYSSDVTYSALLFFVGLLYVALAMCRGKLIYTVAAALAGNAALWAVMYEYGVTILLHPQFWLIPPAVSLLVGTQLNRDRLSAAQLTAFRYASVTVIYISSTGEMFISGIGDALWPPMLLASLSIAGVLVGIMLRIRAFLYLGVSFLMLAIISMVWHAAQNIGHVWPWWAFGIASGIAILVLFGVFEKNRRQVQQMVDQMRLWDP